MQIHNILQSGFSKKKIASVLRYQNFIFHFDVQFDIQFLNRLYDTSIHIAESMNYSWYLFTEIIWSIILLGLLVRGHLQCCHPVFFKFWPSQPHKPLSLYLLNCVVAWKLPQIFIIISLSLWIDVIYGWPLIYRPSQLIWYIIMKTRPLMPLSPIHYS